VSLYAFTASPIALPIPSGPAVIKEYIPYPIINHPKIMHTNTKTKKIPKKVFDKNQGVLMECFITKVPIVDLDEDSSISPSGCQHLKNL
jgi:hypothetical protein